MVSCSPICEAPLASILCLLVPVRTTVQPTRQGAPPEMVPRFLAEGEEENPAGVGSVHPRETFEDV